VQRKDGPLKVTGRALYASDVAAGNPAYAYFHTSAIALGKVVSIDERDARSQPGVLDILTWKNAAGEFNALGILSQGGIASTSMMPLQSPEIRHEGEIIAVVLAESYEAARDASNRLIVTYEERSPTATFGDEGLVAKDATEGTPWFVHPAVGDAEAAFAAASVKIDQRYATPIQHHNPIELFTTTASWEGDKLVVHEPSQFVVGMHLGIAAQLQLDPAKVRLVSPYVGGAFGAKGSVTPRTALVAMAAKRLGRPVKLVATRSQGFNLATYRAETRHRIRLGATAEGRLTSLTHEGEELTSRPDSFMLGGTEGTARLYAIPNVATTVTVQHADRDTPGYMRAPPEGPYMFALESAMDELAIELEMDPVELRRINDTPIELIEGRPYSSRSLKQCFEMASAAFGWSDRDPRPMSMMEGDWQIGWGCASAYYTAKIAASFARVTLMPTGALVEVAGHEIGTGAYTIYAQVAAQSLGLRVEQVEVQMGDSRLPPAPIAAGANNAASISNAVANVCASVRDRLAAAAVADGASRLSGYDPTSLTLAGGALRGPDGASETLEEALPRVGGALEILGGFEPREGAPGALAALRRGQVGLAGGFGDRETVKASFGAEFVEVRVHRRTREVRVPRIVGAFAAGTIVNPMTARSQLMGGMIWGISSALHEATEIDHRYARYTNNNLAEYLIPVNADVPQVEVLFVPEVDTKVNALGIKGVGEIGGVGTAAAICNAIYHATGVRIRDLPVRIEQLLA
jgi:xanthine dehydrogenase YagR molybdenum-binding subunit